MAYVAIADRDARFTIPTTFIEKYIWSQDHKVIAIQYAIVAIFVGLVALVLSGLMRLQLGFPRRSTSSTRTTITSSSPCTG
jgi:cytochrome c oxidase subunit 1